MDRRLLSIVAIGVVIVAVVAAVVLGTGSPAGPPVATPGASTVATPAASVAAVATTRAAASSAALPSVSPACVETTRLEAVRAVAPDTGFPVPVRWTDLGPADDLFFTLSDVSPTIPIDPAGPATLTLGLGYLTGGDRFAFTAGSVDLVYDPASGAVTGSVDTGFGKNSNRATTDTTPSRFDGVLTRAAGANGNGTFTGSIAHAARTFAFTVEMTERVTRVSSGPGCPSVRPTDASFAP